MSSFKKEFLFEPISPIDIGIRELRSSNVRSLIECSLLCNDEIYCTEFSIQLTAFAYLMCVLFNVHPNYERSKHISSSRYPKFYRKNMEKCIQNPQEINLVEKICSQSSEVRPGTNCIRAIDRRLGHDCAIDGCMHTKSGDPKPWWKVDLGESHVITKVLLYNRNKLFDRLHHFTIHVQDSPMPGSYDDKICVKNVPYKADLIRTVQCTTPVIGRYLVVSIDLPGAILTLAEIRAFGC